MIDNYKDRLPIRKACLLSQVSKSSYYYQRRKKERKEKDSFLLLEIKKVVEKFPGYGYRRVTLFLKKKGILVNHKKVLRLMREGNLIKKRKKKILTTRKAFSLSFYPNLTKGFIPKRPNELWVADITYIRLREGFCYLATIIDAFSRKVVGWALKNNLTDDLTLSALRMALLKRKVEKNLIHHSDQGAQYTSKEYLSLLETSGILISMSAKGCPHENALAESFIATLKKEEVSLSEYENITEALKEIGYFIEEVYNRKRFHSSLNYLSPVEFEEEFEKSRSFKCPL